MVLNRDISLVGAIVPGNGLFHGFGRRIGWCLEIDNRKLINWEEIVNVLGRNI